MLLALLVAFIPFVGWLGLVMMAIVTLRQGALPGAYFVVTLLIPVFVLMSLAQSQSFAFFNTAAVTILLWILAIVLRETRSWSRTFEAGTLLTLGLILFMQGFAENVGYKPLDFLAKLGDGRTVVDSTAIRLSEVSQIPLNTEAGQYFWAFFAKIATSLASVSMLLSATLLLLVARGLQAVAFNPGGFGKELREIRLNWLVLSLFAFILVGIKLEWVLAYQLLPAMLLPFSVAGISLVHRLLSQLPLARMYLTIFYLLILFLFPYMLLIVMLCAIADVYFDFRTRFNVSRVIGLN